MHILVAALDWGLGHTTRTIPLIYQLRNAGHTIIIGASKNQYPLYSEHFPEIPVEKLPSFQPKLGKGRNQIWALAWYIPRFLINIRLEHLRTKKIVKAYTIDTILSDNRYGVYSGFSKNTLLTHQLTILLPDKIKFLQGFVCWFIHRKINKFDICLIPDIEGPLNLSGRLSFPVPTLKCQVNFFGLLSRFELFDNISSKEKSPELLIILSGPEHQRTQFENTVINALEKAKSLPCYLLVRGLPFLKENKLKNSLAYADAQTLGALIRQAKYIICRSGYSTIMDLCFLGKTAMLIPTPGQTEQEYLAEHLSEKGLFLSEPQHTIDIEKIIACLDNFKPDLLFRKWLENPDKRLPLENLL